LLAQVGGILSHGAVVAREFGVPCVSAVAGATRAISTGDTVHICAETGTVTIVARAAAAAAQSSEPSSTTRADEMTAPASSLRRRWARGVSQSQ